MAIEMTSPRTRRSLLVAAAGAVAATAVAAIERPAPVRAGTDGDVVLGAENTAGSVTSIKGLSDQQLLSCSTPPSEGAAEGAVIAAAGGFISGVSGRSTDRTGVSGESIFGVGVRGSGSSGIGVWGSSDEEGLPGVLGENAYGIGVEASSKHGVALSVEGRATFSHSGRATVAAGKRSATVTVGQLGGTPLCFATLMGYRPGVFVIGTRPNYPDKGKMRIYLNKTVSSSTHVAWVVFEAPA